MTREQTRDQGAKAVSIEELQTEAQRQSRLAQQLNRARELVIDAKGALDQVDLKPESARLLAEAERLNAARLKAIEAGKVATERAKFATQQANALAEAARLQAESKRYAERAEGFATAARQAEERAANLGAA